MLMLLLMLRLWQARLSQQNIVLRRSRQQIVIILLRQAAGCWILLAVVYWHWWHPWSVSTIGHQCLDQSQASIWSGDSSTELWLVSVQHWSPLSDETQLNVRVREEIGNLIPSPGQHNLPSHIANIIINDPSHRTKRPTTVSFYEGRGNSKSPDCCL